MHDELAEIRDFLSGCPPFDTLAPDSLAALTPAFVIRYLRRGSAFPPADARPCLWLIRQGAIDLRTDDGQLARRMSEGDVHEAPCLPGSPEQAWDGIAIEDTLVYALPQAALEKLWESHPELRQQALHDLGDRLRRAGKASARALAAGKDPGSQRLDTLIVRAPVCAGPSESIRHGAGLMTRERVSALLVVDHGRLCGIVTDRDLRSRCLAAGLPDSAPLAAIMTPSPATLPPEAPAFTALLTMTRLGIHHLPVVADDRLHGLLSSTDLLRAQGVSSLHLADRIRRAGELAELAGLAGELPELWRNLARRGENADVLGHIVSGIADTLAGRLLELAEARRGAPPVRYAWIAFGSQGRQEMTLHSDQDNALILADDFNPDRDGAYFAELAGEVCTGLATCGFTLCPGEMMASNPQWRLPLAGWQALFDEWIAHTDPQKARLACNLFDFRLVRGDPALAAPLREQIRRDSPRHQTLLTRLVDNGCSARPPLGFFRNFVVDRDGEHAGELDLKRQGLLLIVDLARIHALAAGSGEIATPARLRAAAGGRLLSREGADSLIDAYAFLGELRRRHHCERLEQGLPPDNFIAPDRLNTLERQHLRDVFLAISRQQRALLLAFPPE